MTSVFVRGVYDQSSKKDYPQTYGYFGILFLKREPLIKTNLYWEREKERRCMFVVL